MASNILKEFPEAISNFFKKRKTKEERIEEIRQQTGTTAQDLLNAAIARENQKINQQKGTTQEEVALKQPKVFRDADTGKLSGVSLPDGRNLIGIKGSEVEAITKKFAPEETPVGAVEASQIAAQQRAQELLSQLGQNSNLQGESAQIDIGQALASGLTAAVPGVIGGAAVGSFAGGIGAIPGAVIGGIGAFLGGAVSNVRGQYSGEISAEVQNVRSGTTNLRAIVAATNPGNADQMVPLFNFQLAKIDEANNNLYLTTRSNTAKFVGKDGRSELERFEIFNLPGGQREILTRAMVLAMAGQDNSALINQIALDESLIQ